MNEDFDLDQISNMMKDVINDLGLRFYDMNLNEVSKLFRILIDRKEGSITIDDCKKVSKMISKKIDDADLVTFRYTLEVSSPGVERPLKRPEHYEWAMGKLVEIDIGEKKIKGYLRDTKEKGVIVATDLGEDLVPYNSILRAKVVEDLEYGRRR